MDSQDNSRTHDDNNDIDSALAELFPSLGYNFSNPLAVLLSTMGSSDEKGGHGTNLYNPFNLPPPRLQEIHAMATANLISQTQEAIMQEYNFLDLDFENTFVDRCHQSSDRLSNTCADYNSNGKHRKSYRPSTEKHSVLHQLHVTDISSNPGQYESIEGTKLTEFNVSLQQKKCNTVAPVASKRKSDTSEDEIAVANLINPLTNEDNSFHNSYFLNKHVTPDKRSKLEVKDKDCPAALNLNKKSIDFAGSDIKKSSFLEVEIPANDETNTVPSTAKEMQTDCRSFDSNCVVNDSTEDVLMDNVLYVCHICSKQFTCLEDMNMHCSSHQRYVCPQEGCAKTFTYRSHYQYHLKTHTGLRGYQCEVCGSAFSASHHLAAHMGTHTGDRPFICSQCDKAFNTLSQLNNHERTHTGKKPYKCDVPGCDKSFAESSSLKKHKVTHSGIVINNILISTLSIICLY
ncbi:hypothetical protein DPMN_101740 [Dreissena polymorpha]|uniref:C2H2-type domain-containing protein n=1 Tax=Dreissena polymorpha TaxID=45954 RepID=A0A9D4LKG8_DREPO|nr:hypothetical protein DPMN_101740 [Dreissena polymorpha]